MTTESPVAAPWTSGVPAIDNAAARVEQLREKRARITAAMLEAEAEFIGQVAQAHRAGGIDWRGMLAAYEQVRAWSKAEGVTGHGGRWLAQISYDWQSLTRLIETLPVREDGTWRGDTGFDRLHKSKYPGRGAEVAFVLFGNGGAPVFIGYTCQFYRRLQNLDREGIRWESWLALPCVSQRDSVEVRRQLVVRYGQPNIAAQPATVPAPTASTGPASW
ncbi:hypothetical protein [Actinosynnema sp. NPDC023587]|uniref:hypothetical protein n=1 Tax=Actinosynnema sp. NPDC023587 TaxID=3154695 RepID=UPI0033E15895